MLKTYGISKRNSTASITNDRPTLVSPFVLQHEHFLILNAIKCFSSVMNNGSYRVSVLLLFLFICSVTSAPISAVALIIVPVNLVGWCAIHNQTEYRLVY